MAEAAASTVSLYLWQIEKNSQHTGEGVGCCLQIFIVPCEHGSTVTSLGDGAIGKGSLRVDDGEGASLSRVLSLDWYSPFEGCWDDAIMVENAFSMNTISSPSIAAFCRVTNGNALGTGSAGRLYS